MSCSHRIAPAILALAVTLPAAGQDAKNEPSFEETVEQYMTIESTKETCGEVQLDLIVDAFKFWPELGRALITLSEDPDNAVLHYRAGNLYARAGAQRLAGAAFECATRLDKSFVKAWNNLGVLYLSQREFDAAISALQRATKLDPTYARGYYNLGMAYDTQHEYDQAIESYETALKLDPRLADARYNPQVAQNPHRVSLFLKRLLEERALVGGGLDETP